MNLDAPAPPRRILVVDDNRDLAVTLALLLGDAGHHVEQAHTGPAALGIARTFLPEIVFLDLVMPRMDGFAVCEALREQERGTNHRARIIALTGHGEEAYREATVEEGFDGYLQKPYDVEALLTLISAAPIAMPAFAGDAQTGRTA